MANTPKKRSSKRFKSKCPNRHEIENGFYLDFEGYKNSLPALCGYRIGGTGPVTYVAFTNELKWAAKDSGIELKDRHSFYRWLVDEKLKNRVLFAFSEHEDKMLQKMSLPKNPGQAPRKNRLKRYRNVLTIAKRGFKGKTPDNFENSLVNFCDLAGIPIGEEYGKGEVTKWLSEVKKYSCSKYKWKSAPQSARDSWQKILNHNAIDVTRMYDLLASINSLD